MFIPTSKNSENYLSDCPIIQIPRKTNIAYFSLAALKKGGLLKWNDKFGRKFTYTNEDYTIQQVREENIVKNLQENLADIGITRQSYIAESTGIWPEPGTKIRNLYITEKLDYCPDIILPITLTSSNKYEEKILVQPNIKKTSELFFDLDYEKYYLYSVPSGLKLGIGFLGIVRTLPLKEIEFKGDIGENGYSYERLKKYETIATSKFEINKDYFELESLLDFPIIVKNENSEKDRIDEIIKKFSYGSHRLGNSVKIYEWEKEKGGYVSKEIPSKSINKEILNEIKKDMENNYFIFENGKGKTFLPGSILTIFYKSSRKDLELPIPDSSVRYKEINSSNSLKKVVSKAVKNNVEYILFVGKDEEENNKITVKNIKKRKQETIDLKELRNKIFDSEELSNVLLIQEKGVKNFERRLNLPGKKYKEKLNYNTIYGNYKDIPKLILDGYIDAGVTGYDILLEYLANRFSVKEMSNINEFNNFAKKNKIPVEIIPTGECGCKICLANPENLEEIKNNYGKNEKEIFSTLVTPYPNLAKSLFKDYKIIDVTGTTEVYPFPIFDVVGIGETLRRNKKYIAEELFESESIIIKKFNYDIDDEERKWR